MSISRATSRRAPIGRRPGGSSALVFLLGSMPWTLVGTASRCFQGWRRRAPPRTIRSDAVSSHLGAVRVRLFLAVRFQAHSLHLAGVAGARAADGRPAGGCLRARPATHGVVDPRLPRSRSALCCLFAPRHRRAVGPQRVFRGAGEAARADRGAARRLGLVRAVAAPPRRHPLGGIPGGGLVPVGIAA